jgi:hypothetical protein
MERLNAGHSKYKPQIALKGTLPRTIRPQNVRACLANQVWDSHSHITTPRDLAPFRGFTEVRVAVGCSETHGARWKGPM